VGGSVICGLVLYPFFSFFPFFVAVPIVACVPPLGWWTCGWCPTKKAKDRLLRSCGVMWLVWYVVCVCESHRSVNLEKKVLFWLQVLYCPRMFFVSLFQYWAILIFLFLNCIFLVWC